MIYLDHAASTSVFPSVLEAMLPWLQPERVGNPSSIHTQGINARHAVDKARKQVAQMIGADSSEIFFTSGGTESNNVWVNCLKDPNPLLLPIVLTTRLEHHSVLETFLHQMVHTEYIGVNSDGSVDVSDLERRIKLKNGYLSAVSVMWVNNEIGTVNPIKEIGDLCKKYSVPLHTDAVAAAGHVKINVHDCNVDFLSLSGHKFGAPQGVGALYISNRIQKKPWIFGGGQENGLRGGTENVPGIVGLGEAAEIITLLLPQYKAKWNWLRELFLSELGINMRGEYRVNGNEEYCCPNIVSLTIPGVNSESLLLLLDQQDIYLSAGSACSASDTTTSHVLREIGLSEADAACTVRISMGFDTTESDVRKASQSIANTAHRLKAMYS